MKDLVADGIEHVKGVPGCDGVDEEVAVDSDEVFGLQDGVFVLGT